VNKSNDLFGSALKSPFLWGVLGAGAFFALVHGGPLATPFITRYFTNHPVEYAETVLFSVGLAFLVLRGFDVACQQGDLRRMQLAPPRPSNVPIEEGCRALHETVGRLPRDRREDYFPRRLRHALEYLRTRGNAAGLGDELKYLAEHDSGRLQNGYALFHVILWAIPILGFLGTVIGITMALNALDPQALDESMMKVTTGLGVKFDTTALALGMSMVLMFVYFFVHRLESRLLDEVDRRAVHDIGARFPQTGSAETAMIQRGAADSPAQWDRLADALGKRLQQALGEALTHSLAAHAERLAGAEQAAGEQHRRHWEQIRQTHAESIQALGALQAELSRQAKVLGRAVEVTGEVTRLQDVLNNNLAALGGAKHIEQTVSGLAAAIHLLNARLAEAPARPGIIQLEPGGRTAKAA
jgi:hypothetical protein